MKKSKLQIKIQNSLNNMNCFENWKLKIVNPSLLNNEGGLSRTIALATRGRSPREQVRLVRGFTMLELLIVIVIIGVLAGFVVVNFPAAQERARDTQRKSDLKQLQVALESFANKNDGLYPRRSAAAGKNASVDLCQTDLGYSANECPVDPRDGQADCAGGNTCRYLYQTNDSCGSGGDPCAVQYVLWGALERPVNDEFWVICSNGVSGEVAEGNLPPTGGACPI